MYAHKKGFEIDNIQIENFKRIVGLLKVVDDSKRKDKGLDFN